jgi:hypothetical protein
MPPRTTVRKAGGVSNALPGATEAPRQAVIIATAGALVLLAAETVGEYGLGLAAQQSRMTWLFALYSVTDVPEGAKTATARKSAKKEAPDPTVAAPAIAAEVDYDALTLAQLRARIQSLSVTDLRALLAYEESARARAPFQTLLANRITRATAK